MVQSSSKSYICTGININSSLLGPTRRLHKFFVFCFLTIRCTSRTWVVRTLYRYNSEPVPLGLHTTINQLLITRCGWVGETFFFLLQKEIVPHSYIQGVCPLNVGAIRRGPHLGADKSTPASHDLDLPGGADIFLICGI